MENLHDANHKRQERELDAPELPLSSTTMASVEQPLKKRKLHDSPPSESPHSPPPQPPGTSAPILQTLPPPPLSQEEILEKRRNKDAIRNLYDGYKRIKRCLLQKQGPSTPELDHNFLALIASSRGNL